MRWCEFAGDDQGVCHILFDHFVQVYKVPVPTDLFVSTDDSAA